jgi:hypothetical protein
MNLTSVETFITDDDLETSFGNANFGSKSKRDVVKYSLLKYACGYSTGYTAKCILLDLGLLSNSLTLTTKGKEYLFFAFYEGNSY